MTTDNRTNEQLSGNPGQFTEAQVEAAAKALRADEGFMEEVHSALEVSWSEYIARLVLVAAQGAAPAVTGSMSDGYHTFDELYEYRMLYNAHAAHGWLAAGIPVVKSWRHSDGELCFGGGWFIVTATLPSGQASNHYKAEHWGLFKVPEVYLPPEYDGHTPHDAARRLRIEAEYAAPVLPSSGVDEEKLAAVIGKVTDSWDEPLDEVHDIPQIARAVAAWLKDGAR